MTAEKGLPPTPKPLPRRYELPNDLAYAIRFGRFCMENGVDPDAAAQLVILARKAFKAGERDCNEGSEASSARYEKATDAFNALAHSLGFAVQWPGLWPTLLKGGRSIYELPT